MGTEKFYIVSVYHTARGHRFVTLWRPKDAGYCWPLQWAGEYPEDVVRSALDYYNDGERNIAVLASALKEIAVLTPPGVIDGDAGPVVPNTAFSWKVILKHTIEKPAQKPRPAYARKRLAA